MGKKKRTGPCIYCGRVARLTRDHVPPRALFPDPKPRLGVVYSCRQCNEGFSNDEEYFRTVLCLEHRAFNHPAAAGVAKAVLRALQMPEKRGMTDALLASMQPVRLQTPAGIYLGESSIVNVDLRRVFRVVEKIVRGLHLLRFDSALPPDAGVRVIHAADVNTVTDPELMPLVKAILRGDPSRTPDAAFGFFAEATEVPGATGWALLFYRAVAFIVLTVPGEVAARVRARGGGREPRAGT